MPRFAENRPGGFLMPNSPIRSTIVFDAYGTLFDVAGAARLAAAEPGGEALASLWARLAEDWRIRQMEYTWLRTVMGAHADFAEVTADALDWALDAHAVRDPALRTRLLQLYNHLPAYPEVHATLAGLATKGKRLAILSNGTPRMLADAVASARIGDLLDVVISIEEAGRYKPDPSAYALVPSRMGVTPSKVLYVTANGWDAAGAARFGFTTAWINRASAPIERLSHGPSRILPDLSALLSL